MTNMELSIIFVAKDNFLRSNSTNRMRKMDRMNIVHRKTRDKLRSTFCWLDHQCPSNCCENKLNRRDVVKMDTATDLKRKSSENEIEDHPDNQSNVEEKKLKYPKSIFFIVSNEFCERFCYYGMRTVLALYLTTMLKYSEDDATMIYHVFTCFVYFFPLLGAIVSDSWLGKFRTILYLSVIYAVGQLLLSGSAAPPFNIPQRPFSLLGLFLIAIGTGGIKPCVSAFGGDQFILPQQERYLATFFSVFYFSINTGSLISTLLTPVIRETKCFEDNCFSLAFLVPAILMILSIVIFAAGKPLYKIVKPEGNLIVKVSKCVCHAIHNKIHNKGNKRDHWLDYADDTYDNKLIEDTKSALRVLKLFIPLPIFWALYDQQGSQWTFQATRMDGQIGSFVLLPDQLQAVNPLLIVIFIPIFETCIYPLLARIHFIDTPLKKLVAGGFLASLAFVAAGIVELGLEATYPELPTLGSAQIRIFNTMNCQVSLTIKGKELSINSLSMWEDLKVNADKDGSIILSYRANFAFCNDYTNNKVIDGNITAAEATASSWAITPEGLIHNYTDKVDKPDRGKPLVRSLIYLAPNMNNTSLKFVSQKETVMTIPINRSLPSELVSFDNPSDYDVYLGTELLEEKVSFRLGGVYTVVGSMTPNVSDANSKPLVAGKTITVTQPNKLHMALMLPQYVIITMAEVMFSVTGLQFAFTQAPESMKSLLQAGWLLSVAFGNLIVVIIKGSRPFQRQLLEIFLYAGLMAVIITIFAVMTLFYKYVESPENEDISLERKKGSVNEGYKEDEK